MQREKKSKEQDQKQIMILRYMFSPRNYKKMIKTDLMFGKASADRTGFLGTEIEREELLVLVCFSKCRLLLLWSNCQDLSYGFTDNLAAYYKTSNNLRSKHFQQSNEYQIYTIPDPFHYLNHQGHSKALTKFDKGNNSKCKTPFQNPRIQIETRFS